MKSRLGDIISNIIAIAVFSLAMAAFLTIADARQAQPAPAPAAPAATAEIKPTEEIQILKYDNLKMRTILFQQQAQEVQKQLQEAGAKLDADWAALEKDLRAALKVPADYVFDKQKGIFAAPAVNTPPVKQD